MTFSIIKVELQKESQLEILEESYMKLPEKFEVVFLKLSLEKTLGESLDANPGKFMDLPEKLLEQSQVEPMELVLDMWNL